MIEDKTVINRENYFLYLPVYDHIRNNTVINLLNRDNSKARNQLTHSDCLSGVQESYDLLIRVKFSKIFIQCITQYLPIFFMSASLITTYVIKFFYSGCQRSCFDRPRIEHSCATTNCQARVIVRQYLREPFLTAS